MTGKQSRKDRNTVKFTTKCIHGSGKRFDNTGAVSVPVFQTATIYAPGGGANYELRLQSPAKPNAQAFGAGDCNLEEGVVCSS